MFRTKANLRLQYDIAYIHVAIYWWKKSVHIMNQVFNFHSFCMYSMWYTHSIFQKNFY